MRARVRACVGACVQVSGLRACPPSHDQTRTRTRTCTPARIHTLSRRSRRGGSSTAAVVEAIGCLARACARCSRAQERTHARTHVHARNNAHLPQTPQPAADRPTALPHAASTDDPDSCCADYVTARLPPPAPRWLFLGRHCPRRNKDWTNWTKHGGPAVMRSFAAAATSALQPYRAGFSRCVAMRRHVLRTREE
jgi:hypothetical protein